MHLQIQRMKNIGKREKGKIVHSAVSEYKLLPFLASRI